MKVLQVLGLVMLVGVFSAFSWGNRSKSSETSSSPSSVSSSVSSSASRESSSQMEARNESSTSAPVARYGAEARSSTVSSNVSRTSAVDSKTVRSSSAYGMSGKTPAAETPATAAAGAAGFPTELISALAQGDEETRRARIESLKRLSQALAQVRSQQPPPSQPVVEEPAEKDSGFRWGR